MSDVFPESPLSSPPATCGKQAGHGTSCILPPDHTAVALSAHRDVNGHEWGQCDATEASGGWTWNCKLIAGHEDEHVHGNHVWDDPAPGSFGIGPGETIIAEFPVAAAPELAAAMAEAGKVRDVTAWFAAQFRDTRSDGWRARVSGTILARKCAEAGIVMPAGKYEEGEPLTAYESLDAACAAALETVDALDADNARLAAECAALTASHGKLHEQLAEVRRIAYQGGQDGESVRRELIAYLEARDG